MGETLAGKSPVTTPWISGGFATLAVCWGHMGSVGFRFVGGVFYPEYVADQRSGIGRISGIYRLFSNEIL